MDVNHPLPESGSLIRYATDADVPLIYSLIHELAAYEKASSSVKATESSLRSTLSFPTADSSTEPSDSPNFTTGYARTLLVFSDGKEDISKSDDSGNPIPQPSCAGMALFFTNYSTWIGAPGIFLEDLFIRPQYRRRGYASLLFQELGKEVERLNGGQGGGRLEWSVLKWNQPSIDFYERAIGANKMDEWVGMRVEGEGLARLAKGKMGQK